MGAALARRLREHLDTDAFYWLATDPPFQTSRTIPERLAMLEAALGAARAAGSFPARSTAGATR